MSHKLSHFLGAFLAGTGFMAVLPMAALAVSFPTIMSPPSGLVVAPTPDVQVLLAAKTPLSPYRTFSYNGYSFEIPRSWTAKVQGTVTREVVFTGADGKRAASLECPPMPFGLEGMDVASYPRSVVKNGFKYDIELNIATPEGEKKPTFAYISMLHAGYKGADKDWLVDPGYGCQLTLDNIKDLSATAKRIYRSVRVESWKTLSAAGLTLRYPAGWTVKTADIAEDWKHKIFSDVNGKTVAELDCPIQARGLEGFEGPTFERSVPKSGGKIVIERMSLKSIDVQNGEAYPLEVISWSRPEPTSGDVDHAAFACTLYSPQTGQTGIFREIYRSLK